MTRARPVEALLALVATMVATWPLTTLLEDPTWVNDVLLVTLVVAVCGVLGRWLVLRGWQVLVLQLVVVLLTATTLYGRGHLWYGLPTGETVQAFRVLLTEAVETVQTYTAPAPTTRGIRLLLGTSVGLVAAVVDYLAVTRRAPSVAGLPLLAVFLSSAANSGGSLHPLYFVAAAGAWLVLVARQGTSLVRRWGARVAKPLTPVRDFGENGVTGYAAMARSLGIAALVAAVMLPLFLPHLPTRFLLEGLGRNDDAVGGRGAVGFSQSLDLAADLASRSTAPVLVYRSNDTSPPPLRVSVSTRYGNGLWPASSFGAAAVTSADPAVPAPAGLSGSIARVQRELEVTRNNLAAPSLAAPYPIVAADMDVDWGVDSRTQQAVVSRRPASYSVRYLQVTATPTQLRQSSIDPPDDGFLSLQQDRASAEVVSELAANLTAGVTSRYDQAMAVQQFLREDGGFVYSLTLAPTGVRADGAPLDPLTNFLATKRGYCVQFATAMVMMARSLGIPARMAKGFLPGTQSGGEYTVTASDAHAWPELYFGGIGWTRFEPTPSIRSGTAPAYATPSPQNQASNAGGPQEEVPLPSRTGSLRDNSLDANPDLLPTDEAARPAVVRWLLSGWGLVLLAGVLGVAGALVVPAAARWRRRATVLAARTDAEHVEAQWAALSAQLGDLGMPPNLARTPRQLRSYYEQRAFLDRGPAEALGRVVMELERARYAPPSPTLGPVQGSAPQRPTIEPDARVVLKAVAAARPLSVRWRARLWPQSGKAQVRDVAQRLRARLAEPLDDAAARLRQTRLRRLRRPGNRRRG